MVLLLPRPAVAIDGRLGHETGDALGRKNISAETLDVQHEAFGWRYRLVSRRDQIANDRTLLNAAALVSGGLEFSGHKFSPGLGTHFNLARPEAAAAQAGSFFPAAGFAWQHARFDLEVLGSEKLTQAYMALPFTLLIPLAVQSSFLYIESQPYRWTVEVHGSISRFGGLIAGFEPVSNATRAGLWVSPLENLSLRALTRISPGGQAFLEFSMSYTVQLDQEESPASAARVEKPPAISSTRHAQAQLPAFATLVKWGLAPVAALKLSRERNICALDQNSRAILARHHWECRDAT